MQTKSASWAVAATVRSSDVTALRLHRPDPGESLAERSSSPTQLYLTAAAAAPRVASVAATATPARSLSIAVWRRAQEHS